MGAKGHRLPPFLALCELRAGSSESEDATHPPVTQHKVDPGLWQQDSLRFPGSEDWDDRIAALVANVDQDSLVERVRVLQDFYSRYVIHPGIDLARDFIFECLEAFGLEVHLEQFDFWSWWTGWMSAYNVAGELEGTIYPDQYVLLGGHYDAITFDAFEDPSQPARGADDNAAAVAAVLGAAHLMAGPGME